MTANADTSVPFNAPVTPARGSTHLGPTQREHSILAMQSGELDVLIVGGGVTGAGAALDAATRGLSVGIVEMRDWSAGTSSRSSKLIHGGLRYLEMFDFNLVSEALRERGLLLQRLAPHLVRPVKFMYPLTTSVVERPYVTAGLTLYDTMGLGIGSPRGVPGHRQLTKGQALKACPSMRKESLVGAVQYYDAQVDDARFVTALVRTAAGYGALAANRCRVVGFNKEGERVVGATVADLDAGTEFTVRAKQIVNATGVWTDETQALVGERGQFKVRASKGIHLVVPRDRILSDTGLILRTEKSVLFVIPWKRHWIIGTTDTEWDLDKSHPAASAADIDYLLDHVNEVLTTPLTREDVEGVYAGLRPLLAGENDETSQLSREHVVAHPTPGVVVVAGGKYTTYRVMAEDAINEVARALDFRVADSCTDEIALTGADGYQASWNARKRIAQSYGVHVARVEHLLNRYGTDAYDVLDMIAANPELGQPIEGAADYLKAEVVFAVEAEDARHVPDVLTRRTRIHIETWDRGIKAARSVAELMAPTLGWNDTQIEREVSHYLARVEAERRSQEQWDDETADAVRLGAPEVVPVEK